MIINRINFPFYGIIIVLSIIIGMLYIYVHIKEDIQNDKRILLYFLMYIVFSLICGKIFTVLAYGEKEFLSAGLSSYGGLIGVVIAAIIFENIISTNGKIIKYTIISLPLIYGLSKIACFIVGCCGGIPYEGLFKIKYIDELNIWQFPIQLVEVIVFLVLFIICLLFRNKKNINYIVLLLISLFKFSLDFLRYDHINKQITPNQIFSIILFIITIIVWIYNSKKNKSKVII